jgi:hypothetical protein
MGSCQSTQNNTAGERPAENAGGASRSRTGAIAKNADPAASHSQGTKIVAFSSKCRNGKTVLLINYIIITRHGNPAVVLLYVACSSVKVAGFLRKEEAVRFVGAACFKEAM